MVQLCCDNRKIQITTDLCIRTAEQQISSSIPVVALWVKLVRRERKAEKWNRNWSKFHIHIENVFIIRMCCEVEAVEDYQYNVVQQNLHTWNLIASAAMKANKNSNMQWQGCKFNIDSQQYCKLSQYLISYLSILIIGLPISVNELSLSVNDSSIYKNQLSINWIIDIDKCRRFIISINGIFHIGKMIYQYVIPFIDISLCTDINETMMKRFIDIGN